MTCGHRNCRYRDNTAGCCEFILIEGHSRGCRPEDCREWRTGKKRRRTAVLPTVRKRKCKGDVKERMRMYINGATDREMSEKLGVATSTIIAWRKRNGLIAHKKARVK